jgi:ABC-2 type transport system ATP-binding protein
MEKALDGAAMNVAIEIASLSNTYGTTLALNGLSLAVESGRIYGLIGPNGAGKTTTLAMLAGLVQPSSGSARILGITVRPGNARLVSRMGFFSPQYPFFDYLTGAEILLTCGMMHRLAPAEARRRTSDLLDLLDLDSAAGQYLAQYSQGMRHKLGLAAALIHAPEILLLDEPFVGLDPVSVYRLVGCLHRMSEQGKTIMISSHDMTLLERLCHRTAILHKGVLVREIDLGSPNNHASGPDSRLEAVLWSVVGAPETIEIPWLC